MADEKQAFERISPVEKRMALEIVEEFKRTGIDFVPVPVFNASEKNRLLTYANQQLDILLMDIEGE